MARFLVHRPGKLFLMGWIFLALVLPLRAFLLSPLSAQESRERAADWLIVNARVYTVDDERPRAEAVAILDGKIVGVGDRAELADWQGERTRLVDVEGRVLVPGFIESHGHLAGLGALLTELDLTETRSWEEVIELVEARTKVVREGEWIIGRGWHQSLWDSVPEPNVDGYPIHDELSRVSPKHPVLLAHRSGHAALANALAMELAGVTSETLPPEGGEILRGADGGPIGVFRETAQGLIQAAYQKATEELSGGERRMRLEHQLSLAEEKCFSVGVTTFVDAGISPSQARSYLELAEGGRLRLPVWVLLRGTNEELGREIPRLKEVWPRQHLLTLGGIKQMSDGALGAHGAWLLEPYADLPESRGLIVTGIETIAKSAELCVEHDLQLCVHAIGDRANREVLDLFERVFGGLDRDVDLRWRIEHAQHLAVEDIPRFARLGVIASMQANHCTSDGPFVPARIGDARAEEGAYVWRKLLEQGTVIVNGTDTPVEPVEPMRCFYSAVTRRCRDGSVFYGDQSMTREEALRSYTLDAAYGIKQEEIRGSISVGKQADLVLLSADPMRVAAEEIPKIEVLMTWVGGERVYSRGDLGTESR